MKQFLVTDDQGNPIYIDPYFKERSEMLCLPYAAAQSMVQENFDQLFTSMRCHDNTLFVYTHYNELLYMAVSDEGESVPFLKRQLQLIHELLRFHFGVNAEKRVKKTQHRVSTEASEVLRPLINTMVDLGNNQQSFLVQSIEKLEVNDDLRGKCIKSLEDAFNSQKNHGAIHILLFVGTKIVSHYSKKGAFELIPQDIFLLSLYIKSLQDPSPSFSPPLTENFKPPQEEEYLSANEEMPESGSSNNSNDSHHSDLKNSRRFSSEESFYSPTVEPTYTPTRDLPRLTEHKSVYEKIHLRTGQTLSEFHIYCGQVAEMTTMVVISDTSSEKKEEVMQEMKQSIGRSLDSFLDFLIIKEKTHVTILPFLSHFPGLVHFIYVDRLNHQVVAPMIVSLQSENDTQSIKNFNYSDEEDLEKTRKLANPLKKKVWHMVALAQDRLSQGYSSMTFKAGDFQYSYNLWFEDGDGNGLSIDQPIPFPESSFDGNFYRETSRKLFPGNRQVNCFELYTLHLALVPTKQVISQNRKLLKKLREGRPKAIK